MENIEEQLTRTNDKNLAITFEMQILLSYVTPSELRNPQNPKSKTKPNQRNETKKKKKNCDRSNNEILVIITIQ